MGINKKNTINNSRIGLIELCISSSSSKVVIAVILFLLGLSCASFPISILFIDDLEIGFGFVIITIPIFWGSSIYFFRLLLWNHFGKEIYRIEKNKITYYYDYYLFKSNLKFMKFKEIEVAYNTLNNPDELYFISDNNTKLDIDCYLIFIIKTKIIKTHFLVDYSFIEEVSILVKNT
jgi:hypothetical protein